MDYILHQAALGSVPRSIKDPILTHSVNCTGFLNMLTAARDAKVKRFVYAASSSTYGDHPGLPKVEDKIGRPLSPYAVTKYSNELYADVFYKTYGLEVIGLRYFNVFGRRQDPDGAYAAVIPKFIKAILASEAVTINGDGSSSRDFTYIDNVIQANQRAALSSSAESVNQVYNVACGGNVTVLELFETLQRLLQEKVPGLNSNKPLFGPERLGDVQHSTASIEKIMRLLGYSPTDDFHTGIQQTIDWYFKNSK
jgi:UDP-N-acetylglucosamine 4-epimerase